MTSPVTDRLTGRELHHLDGAELAGFRDNRTVVKLRVGGTLILSAFLLAGCSEAEPSVQDDGWASRMTQLLTDPVGQGGAGGLIAADDGDQGDSSPQVTLGSVPAGDYDVLAVCRGADLVKLSVVRLAEAGEPAQTYSEADIPCGATLRVPVVTDVTGVTIRASGPVGAEWEATIVTPDWQPSVTTFG